MTDKESPMMSKPVFRWEWNLNTIVVLLGFAAGLIAWGYAIADIKSSQSSMSQSLDRHDKRLTAVEVEVRRLDNHELRLTTVEKQATDVAGAVRSVETAVNDLATDVRVAKEILERLEERQSGRSRFPP
jgi:hypothetical protein